MLHRNIRLRRDEVPRRHGEGRASLLRIEKGNAIRISNIPAIEIIRTSYRSQEDLATEFWGFGIGPLRHL